MSEFKIYKATRTGVVPLIALYAESGCGKTYSALLLARGLVGPSGDIHVIDTENRRASLYADVLPGGFSVLDLDAPFTPARYIAAMQAVIDAGAKVIVIDSMSHEWEGMGGVLDMAGDNEQRTGKSGLHNWKTPKLEHAKLVQFLLRSPVPVVSCVRAKHKSRQEKDERGKTVIVKDKFTTPIQAEDFIFEMTAHAEVLPNHCINLTKCSHPALRECFPTDRPITIEDGEKIAKWCAAAGGPATAPPKSKSSGKAKLWKVTEAIHKGDPKTLEQYLVAQDFLASGTPLSSLTDDQLAAIAATIEKEAA